MPMMPSPATTSMAFARNGPTELHTALAALCGIPKRSKGFRLRPACCALADASVALPCGPDPDALPDAPRTEKSPVPQPDAPTADATSFSLPERSAERIPPAKGSSSRAAVAVKPVDQSENAAIGGSLPGVGLAPGKYWPVPGS